MSEKVVCLKTLEELEKAKKEIGIWTESGDTKEEELFSKGALFGYRLEKKEILEEIENCLVCAAIADPLEIISNCLEIVFKHQRK